MPVSRSDEPNGDTHVDLSGNFRSKVLNASVRGVKGCFIAVGVRGGTFLISQAFSPEASDIGEPLRRLSSSISALRAARASFGGIMDQMPRARLITNADSIRHVAAKAPLACMQ